MSGSYSNFAIGIVSLFFARGSVLPQIDPEGMY